MFKRNRGENKTKIEHQLYLARENPEPVFDLSDCGLRQVPNGIYSLCRVFLKDTLRLEQNSLSSLSGGGHLKDLHLLRVLDLHENAFTNLPDDICLLTNLQELYINDNHIKKLPTSICSLINLRVLNVANNELKMLPDDMGKLQHLQRFIATGNKHLKNLPKNICYCSGLVSLLLDSRNFVYPPATVVENGTDSIIKFICDDIGISYVPAKTLDVVDQNMPTVDSKLKDNDSELLLYEENEKEFQAKIWKLEKIKAQRQQELLDIEKNNELMQMKELVLAATQKANREKLLMDLTVQQTKLDQELIKLQQEKDNERNALIKQLQEAETNADYAIKQLLTLNEEPLAQLLEQEQKEEARLIEAASRYNESLRRNDVLEAMQTLLEQETQQFKRFDVDRKETARSILTQEVQNDSRLAEILYSQELQQEELVQKLLRDSELQRIAVGTLLERGDARSWGLVQQVKLVESQLATLTSMELERKKLEVDGQVNDFAVQRMDLSMLLLDLLEKQEIRRAELLSTLKNMEDIKDTVDDMFWLRQYQSLLDRRPSGLLEAQNDLNLGVAQHLLMAGVIHCLPFLARWAQHEDKLLEITELQLYDAGVVNSEDRTKILEALAFYAKERREEAAGAVPSAPSVEVEEASAPPLEISPKCSSECVVCMDNVCQVIFTPCGHLCCCSNCSALIAECPLCRSNVEHKIKVVLP